MNANKQKIGISGLAAYIPRLRVQLEDWCEWTGNSWPKISNVVGRSFRIAAPDESVYTMAATAVLRLIRQYEIDPQRVGFLGFGTESSTDNSAGPIIIKGMLDDALAAEGKPRILRSCEVPEFKHACLGGVYAMKGALRYLALDGSDKVAIVVCADIAEYERGSSGEPTQGAGAVAMLVETDPKLVSIALDKSGSASEYRHVDFRKPMVRFCQQNYSHDHRIQDFPVFNGRYSTSCYVDETLHALEDMYQKRNLQRVDYLRSLNYVFMHRPYRRMPETGLAYAYLSALASDSGDGLDELAEYANEAGVDLHSLRNELCGDRQVTKLANREHSAEEAFPMTAAVLHVFRGSPAYEREVLSKLALGSEWNCELGNLYTAALPAWLAAGFEVALLEGLELAEEELLTMGYGSGDAAEIIPFYVADEWKEASARMKFIEALDDAVDVTQSQYEALHDRREVRGLDYSSSDRFVVDQVGACDERYFRDAGIEYYRYAANPASLRTA